MGPVFDGSAIGRGNVAHVHIEKRGMWIALARLADHQFGVADLKYRGRHRLECAGCAEHIRHEINQTTRISNDNPGRDRVPTDRRGTEFRPCHRQAARTAAAGFLSAA